MIDSLSYLEPDGRSRLDRLCPVCDSSLNGAGSCNRCLAPREVIDTILDRAQAPRFIGVLGPSGVGKTVYLGMLIDMLTRGAGSITGLARSPFSLAIHRNLMLALESQRFPAKTPGEPDLWQWIHCEVTGGRRGSVFDIVTPDVAGEGVQNEIERPGSVPIIRALVARCSGLIVLIDVVELIACGSSQELFTLQLISYLASLQSNARRKLPVPVALLFTKVDLCADLGDDLESFARSNTPGLWRLCEARLQAFRFFASSVAGSSARLVDREGRERLVPLRVEPRGIIEPLAWLLQHLR
jgi:hypothetical protein